MDGFNATVFAYGQTNSGKTHSMLGPNGRLSLSPTSMGLSPRCSKLLFARIHDLMASGEGMVQFQVRATFIEIYNGKVFDLLATSGRAPLTIRSDRDDASAVDIVGARQLVVETTSQVLDVLRTGSANRATASTDMNQHSSRSHAVLALHIERRQHTDIGSAGTRFVSRVNLVDLAGSEDVSRSLVAGDRLREAAHINTGLFQACPAPSFAPPPPFLSRSASSPAPHFSRHPHRPAR